MRYQSGGNCRMFVAAGFVKKVVNGTQERRAAADTPCMNSHHPERGSLRRVRPGAPDRGMGLLCVLVSALLQPAWATPAQQAVAPAETFADLSLEDLLAMRVTSVAGVERSFFQTPAALSVISREDLDRAGHRSLPEALRLVPGVHVARTDSNSWSVGTRGFNGGFGTKQLVLIDGRTTYDLLFSGTFWDIQDVLLHDLDRIEVIRGPGATLWGANAVNGVINVTTRHTRDTQGTYLGGGSGTYERVFGEWRYGGEIADRGWFRLWGKYFEREDLELANGESGHDQWHMARGGFRVDLETANELEVTVQGDAYDGTIGEVSGGVPQPGLARGHNLLTRISGGDQSHNGWRLQSYYDRTERVTAGGFRVDRDTVDVDYRNFHNVGRHALIWGAGYRYTNDNTVATPTLVYVPAGRAIETYSAFVQDTFTLQPERSFLMLGSKFEHNELSGFEVQPSARFWYTPDDEKMFWAAVSRPLRTPSRTDEDLAIIVPGVFSFEGNPDVQPERLTAYEMGYRHQFSETLSIDVATFHQDYRRLLGTTGPPTDLTFDNSGSAGATGLEVATTWHPGNRWRFEGSYSYLNVAERGEPVDEPDGSSPQHLLKLLSFAQFGDRLRLDSAAYYVGDIERQGIDSYLRLDAGLTWRSKNGLEWRLRGQNLLDPGHPEVGGDNPPQVPRALYLDVRVTR